MKLFISIFFLMLLTGLLRAQTGTYYDYKEYSQKRIDSLLYVFHNTTDDTVKMAVCRDIGLYYEESKTDSALYFHTLQLQLAKKLNLKLWEADANDLLGYTTLRMGNYTAALQHSMEAHKNCREPGNRKRHLADIKIFRR